MRYSIHFKDSVGHDLKRIDKNQVRRILDKIEETLTDRAGDFPSLTGKYAGLRKFRVGDYRVIYTILDDAVLILRIKHRKDAFR